jgi:hypothetical protein
MAIPAATRHTLSEGERLAWLRLARSEKIGPMTFRRLMRSFGSASKALELLPELARRGRGQPVVPYPATAAADELDRLHRIGGRLVAYCEPDYPAALASTSDAPPVIAALGNASLLRRRSIAIVGARNSELRILSTLTRCVIRLPVLSGGPCETSVTARLNTTLTLTAARSKYDSTLRAIKSPRAWIAVRYLGRATRA